MTPDQTIDLLSVAASYDRRTVGKADVIAWHAAVGHLSFEDSQAAVVAHYSTTREWLMPIDVISGVRRIRDKRLEGVDRIQPPDGLTPLAYRDWLRDTRAAVADGTLAVPAEITGQPVQLKALGGAA